jgi:hypothetical protein
MRMQNTEYRMQSAEYKKRFLTPFFLCVLFVLCGEILAEESGELLRDDYVISGADGLLVGGQNGQWQFEFESDLSDGTVTLKAGQPVILLKSAALEKMIEDAKQREDTRYRLWGKITKFEGKNYVFPSYFVGLRKLDKPAEKPSQQTEKKTQQAINAPNDVLNIPAEIVSQLATSEVLPAETPSAMPLKQDTIFANRTGRVFEKKGKYFFEPDGLGLGVEKGEIELLPCQALNDAMRQVKDEPNPVRFSVAGIMTKYKDQQLLLLQKATRVYSYGNFGR